MNRRARNQEAQAASLNRFAVRAAPVFAAFVVFLLQALPARAEQTVQQSRVVYSTPCVFDLSLLTRHDDGVGAWDGSLSATSILSTFVSCEGSSREYKTFPAGWLAIYQQLQYYPATGGGLALCKSAGWFTNSNAPAHSLVVGNGWGSEPCGPGYYRLDTTAYVWDGYYWRGGLVTSGLFFD